MANAVDKLFDSVLEKLSPEPEHKSYDWPDFDGRDDETDISPQDHTAGNINLAS